MKKIDFGSKVKIISIKKNEQVSKEKGCDFADVYMLVDGENEIKTQKLWAGKKRFSVFFSKMYVKFIEKDGEYTDFKIKFRKESDKFKKSKSKKEKAIKPKKEKQVIKEEEKQEEFIKPMTPIKEEDWGI